MVAIDEAEQASLDKGRSESNVIILGAGASYDFDASMAWDDDEKSFQHVSIPLANQLASEAARAELLIVSNEDLFRELSGVSIEDLKAGASLDVEHLYADLESRVAALGEVAEGDLRFHRLAGLRDDILKAIYRTIAIRVLPFGISRLHRKLAEHILDTGTNVISLNWDTLMEDALLELNAWHPSTGYGIEFWRFYVDRSLAEMTSQSSRVLVLKPHGSMNWFQYVLRSFHDNGFTGEVVSDDELSGVGHLAYTHGFRCVHDAQELSDEFGSSFNPPLKGLIEPGIVPPTTEWLHRPHIAKTIDLVEEMMRNAKGVTVVGFAMKSTDSRFLEIVTKACLERTGCPVEVEIVSPRWDKTKVAQDALLSVCREVFRTEDVCWEFDTLREYCETIA